MHIGRGQAGGGDLHEFLGNQGPAERGGERIPVLVDGPGLQCRQDVLLCELALNVEDVRIEGAGGEGSGLGLAIARDAATRLGGTVTLDDRAAGPGLVFRYRQPSAP